MNYLSRAFDNAIWAIGNCHPNPAVGAVLVNENHSKILGDGFTQQAGNDHAEIVAIKNAIQASSQDIAGSHLYVTLEPCCHYGKTPPCVDSIIENKIKKVFIGAIDPSEKVNGKSMEILKNNNTEVQFISDKKYERAIHWSLESFFKSSRQNLPLVYLKWAQTPNGNLAPMKGPSGKISSSDSKESVFRLRKLFFATMVTPGTIAFDKPLLTSRVSDRSLRLDNTDYFSKMLKRFQTQPPADFYEVTPARIFLLPDFSERFSLKDFTDFIELQLNTGENNLHFYTVSKTQYDYMQKNLYPVFYVENYLNDFEKILVDLNNKGITQILIEAGPEFSDLLLKKEYIDGFIVYKSGIKQHWDETGRGFSLSKKISRRKIYSNVDKNFTLHEQLLIDNDEVLVFSRKK